MPLGSAKADRLGSIGQDLLVGAVFILSVAAWFSAKRIPGWWRALRAATWPIAEGRVEDCTVTTFAEQSLGELAYSYSVEGERYSGYFHQQFAAEQDAWEYIDALKGQGVFVRYKVGSPEVSAIRIDDQRPQFSSRKPLPIRLLRHAIEQLIGVSDLHFPSLLGAKYWALCKGKVESTTVTRRRERNLFYMGYYVCEMSYSYIVAGEYYSGQFERICLRENSARLVASNWKDRNIYVRYREDAPNISTLRNQDQPSQYSA
jgi:hypothetical protein